MEHLHKLSEVYGSNNEPPLSYVERPTVDGAFRQALDSYGIAVLHGRSKQGKSTLRKKYIKQITTSGQINKQAIPYVEIKCSYKTTIGSFYKDLLKTAGYVDYTQHQTTETTQARTQKNLNLSVKILGGGILNEDNQQTGSTKTGSTFPVDIENINDILRALENVNFDKLIILEDFQYVNDDQIAAFTVEFKHLMEAGYRILVIGVWMDKGRLESYNGDLETRVNNIDCSDWTREQMRAVILKGAPYLNIKWSDEIIEYIIVNSFGNIGILQKICYQTCYDLLIYETQPSEIQLNDITPVERVVSAINDTITNRLTGNFDRFVKGLSSSKLKLHSWILRFILSHTTDELRRGLSKYNLQKWLHQHHPQNGNIQSNSVDDALRRIVQLQRVKEINPPLFDYSSQKIMVVDDNLLLFMDRLSSADRIELLERYGG